MRGESQKILLGEHGADYIANTTPVTSKKYGAITALTATVIASMTSTTINGTLTSVSLPAGCTIYGKISALTLASGSIIAYNRSPSGS